jgi:hypothetical protein
MRLVLNGDQVWVLPSAPYPPTPQVAYRGYGPGYRGELGPRPTERKACCGSAHPATQCATCGSPLTPQE